ncbi:MAG: hypothetical protein IJ563_08360, partial [Selenomonadaceae bacterium]|nr:hypothetical protein [Selenomonadaceae bacterium]
MANISNSKSNTIVNGTSGDDYIYNSCENVTINGGAGNDTINLGETNQVIIQYASGDGNDTIYGYGSAAIIQIQITDGSSYSTISSTISNSMGLIRGVTINVGSGS